MDETAAPALSVGMPVYNGEPYLESSLASILGQSFRDLELVISDNASTDETEKICRHWATRDPRVRYFRNDRNVGAAANYNRVFHLSRGRYFKWAAADDLLAEGFLGRCVAELEKDPGVVLSYARTTIIGSDGQPLRPYEDGLDLRQDCPVSRFRGFLDAVGECNAVFGVIRSDVLRRTPLIGHYVGSDIVLLAELSLHGPLHEIPDRLFLRRDHPEASSSNKDVSSQQDFFDPGIRGRAEMTVCRHHLHYLGAVRRSPLPGRQRRSLYTHVLRHAVWDRRRIRGELAAFLRTRFRIGTSSRKEKQ